MGALFKKPKMPAMPSVKKTRMPNEGDSALRDQARRYRENARLRSGRSSTILSDLGSSGNKLGA